MPSSMIVFLILAMLLNTGVGVNFAEVFESSWAPDHITVVGDQVMLTLDNASGSYQYVSLHFYLLSLPSLLLYFLFFQAI